MDYTGFVYIWYDRKRKWFYIGSHMGTLNDGYIGSNIRLQRSYNKRPEDFKRRILKYHFNDNHKELLSMEQSFLDKIKYEELNIKQNIIENTIKYYNVKPTASGISGKFASELRKEWWDSDSSIEWRKKLSEKMKKENPSQVSGFIPWNKGIKCPQISAAKKGKKSNIDFQKKSDITKKMWSEGIFDNRPLPSEETKKKISESGRALNRKQTDYQKQRSREANLGIAKSKEHREKISNFAKERFSKIETCFNCGHIGSGPIMQRWHMNNCRK